MVTTVSPFKFSLKFSPRQQSIKKVKPEFMTANMRIIE